MKHDELVNRFTYHPPKPEADQAVRYEDMRRLALGFAEQVVLATPESREQSLAITKIEEAVFWANAAIARHE